MLTIATWNINGIKARLPVVERWLNEEAPDIVCLQEIKSVDEAFPADAFEALGYNVATHGQKGFNGVAILSKRPFDEVKPGLPGDDDDVQARYLEAIVSDEHGPLRVASIYLPNGNPIGDDKFTYKLAWMERLQAHAAGLLDDEERVVLAGDYNVIPQPEDAARPDAWHNDALFQPESRAAFRKLIGLGYTEAVRAVEPHEGVYTFWDYQAGAWPKNNGIRIDHLLLSPQAADAVADVGIDKHVRGWEKPSDHVPVWCALM
ncbi:MAG: exodeoxyribonuclease III [Pseudomonadota bacterium]